MIMDVMIIWILVLVVVGIIGGIISIYQDNRQREDIMLLIEKLRADVARVDRTTRYICDHK